MLPILFQDPHLVAVDKPAGLLVHRTVLDSRERSFALQIVREQLGRRVYAVHRLDKGTSGILLFALSRDVGRRLSAMFADQEVRKTYLAVVRGVPPEAGEVDSPLAVNDDSPGAVYKTSAPLQAAVTRWRRLASVELPHCVDRYPTSRYALLELAPQSGRRHQLRRHMKHLSHPIIGDTTYGKSRHNKLFDELFGCRRLFLACVELRLRHPITGEDVTLAAPLAADFTSVLCQLGWFEHIPARWT